MPNDDRELIYRAEIQALAFAAKVAIQTQNSDAFSSASRQLLNLSVDIDVPSAIRDIASEIHDALSLAMTDAGLNAMSATVSQLADAADKLRAAINSAKDGKSNLFFPALADAASRALTTFANAKSAVDKVQQDLRTASGAQLGDIPQKLQGLLADLDNLAKAVQKA